MVKSKLEWLEKNGFNEDGITYCVIGNSYPIKDELKQNGYKYSPMLKWHAGTPLIELPDDCEYISINFEDIYKWDDTLHMAMLLEKAESFVKEKFTPKEEPSNSNFIGAIGERLRGLTATYTGSRGFESAYGYKYVHNFTIGENAITWFTTIPLIMDAGITVILTGTVKKHEIYKDKKITQLSRCIVEPQE